MLRSYQYQYIRMYVVQYCSSTTLPERCILLRDREWQQKQHFLFLYFYVFYNQNDYVCVRNTGLQGQDVVLLRKQTQFIIFFCIRVQMSWYTSTSIGSVCVWPSEDFAFHLLHFAYTTVFQSYNWTNTQHINNWKKNLCNFVQTCFVGVYLEVSAVLRYRDGR